MKVLGLLVLLAACALGYVALTAEDPTYVPPRPGDQVPVAIAEDPPEGHELVTLDVVGMCCDGCRGKLYASLVAVDGVRAAAIDHVTGTAEAVVPAGAPVEPLAAALTFDKYVATAR